MDSKAKMTMVTKMKPYTFKTQAEFRDYKQIFDGRVPQHYIILEMVDEGTRALAQQRNKEARETVKGILRDREIIDDLYYQFLMRRLTEPDGDIAEVIIE